MCAPSPASLRISLSQHCPRSLQNVIPLGEGEVDAPQDPETQLQEQEKRIEISCALAAEASRRGRMLSGKAQRDTEGLRHTPTACQPCRRGTAGTRWAGGIAAMWNKKIQ